MIIGVIVCLCCYNTIPETGWFIKNRDLFHVVLETGNCKVKCSPLARAFLLRDPWWKAESSRVCLAESKRGRDKFILPSATCSWGDSLVLIPHKDRGPA
jgi:hypothetical protein